MGCMRREIRLELSISERTNARRVSNERCPRVWEVECIQSCVVSIREWFEDKKGRNIPLRY